MKLWDWEVHGNILVKRKWESSIPWRVLVSQWLRSSPWDELQVELELLREKCLGHITAMTIVVVLWCWSSRLWDQLASSDGPREHTQRKKRNWSLWPSNSKHKWKTRKSKWQDLKSPLSYAVTKKMWLRTKSRPDFRSCKVAKPIKCSASPHLFACTRVLTGGEGVGTRDMGGGIWQSEMNLTQIFPNLPLKWSQTLPTLHHKGSFLGKKIISMSVPGVVALKNGCLFSQGPSSANFS